MQIARLKEAYSGKEPISFKKTAEGFSKAIESGKDVFHIDTDKHIFTDLKDKISSLDVPYLILTQSNDRISIVFHEIDKPAVEKACHEFFLEKGVIPVAVPKYMRQVFKGEPMRLIGGLSELQKEALERQVKAAHNCSIAFEKATDGSYRALWLKSQDEKVKEVLGKTFMCLSKDRGKDYKALLDNEISWKREQKNKDHLISPFEKALKEHEEKMLAIAERFQQYLTFSDTDHALGKESIDLVNAAEMNRPVNDIANVINENITFEEIKEIIEEANDLSEEIIIEDYRTDEEIVQELIETEREEVMEIEAEEREISDREERDFMED